MIFAKKKILAAVLSLTTIGTMAASVPFAASADTTVGVSYSAHVQSIGWQAPVSNGAMAGTEGKALRVEALKVNLTNAPAGATITYQAHVQSYGWMAAVSDGALAGTAGKAKRVEAIKMALNNLPGYELQYRVHQQTYGWSAWVTSANGLAIANATSAGVVGKAKRLEGIEVKLVQTKASTVSATPINTTSVKVDFSAAVDGVAASNFAISKGTVTAAKLSSDNKSATVTVAGLTYGDVFSLTASGIKAAGVELDSKTFSNLKIPSVGDLYTLEITSDAANDTILSDGASKTMLTAKLKDKATGTVQNFDGIVKFQTTLGGLAQTEVAFQNGAASVQLTSFASVSAKEATITATIINAPNAQDYIGIVNQKVITFSPNPQQKGTQTFVMLTAASANQADRFTLTFSDKITVADFIKALPAANILDGTYGLRVNGHTVDIEDVQQETDYSLTFILDTDSAGSPIPTSTEILDVNNLLHQGATIAANFLEDNSTFNVSIPANIGGLVLANTTGVNFTLTDNTRPYIYGVDTVNQVQFSIRTSESLAEDLVEGTVGLVNNHFLLDGKKVVLNAAPTATDIANAKANNQIIATTLCVGNYNVLAKTVDTRNIVYFTLHPSFKLVAGTHMIQIANIGDWAAMTDSNNLVSTQTFDFTVNADTSKPVASVTVQSPEQWLIHIDKPTYETDGKHVEDSFKIYSRDDLTTPLVYGTDYIITPVDATTGNSIRPSIALGGDVQLTDGTDFLVEFLKDWTVKYNTQGTTVNYFTSTKNPYQITVANLQTELNNVMDSQNLNVTLNLDGTSPTMASATDISTLVGKTAQLVTVTAAGQAILVKTSEPVQLRNSGDTNDSVYLTQSQQQALGAGIPIPTFEFVKGDKTVPGQISGLINKEDNTFVVTPETPLEAGTWTLYVRSISDDVGNTSATVTTPVIVPGVQAAVAPTAIAWVGFDNGPTNIDCLYVKFTKVMDPTTAAGVARTTNYVFNGVELPQGSTVERGIKGVTNDWDGVTIKMPKDAYDGYAKGLTNFASVLNVASNFKAADGTALAAPYMVQLADTANASVADNDMAFESFWNNSTLNFGGAAAISGTADDANANGTIDSITLTLDAVAPVLATGVYSIKVNGVQFDTANGNGGAALTFTNATGVATTDTTGLVITNLDGSIVLNSGVITDTVVPQAIAAATNSSSFKVVSATTITVVFSETLKASTFAANNANGFTAGAGAVTATLGADGKTVTITGAGFATNVTKVSYAGAPITDVAGNSIPVIAATATH